MERGSGTNIRERERETVGVCARERERKKYVRGSYTFEVKPDMRQK